MKTTGIVRRIDDLGRVVIPKELRRQFQIQEGEPLEIYTEGEYICLRKYNTSAIEEAKRLRDIIEEQSGNEDALRFIDSAIEILRNEG